MIKLNNKGNATVLAVAICLGIIIIISVVFEYMQMLIITTGIRNAVESATISTVVANYDETYSQLREGYSGGYVYQDTAFTESIDTGNIYTRLDSLLALTENGAEHIKYRGDGSVEYSISNMRLELENTAFAQGNTNKNLNATVYIDVKIPVRFGGREIASLAPTMRVKASYTPKF